VITKSTNKCGNGLNDGCTASALKRYVDSEACILRLLGYGNIILQTHLLKIEFARTVSCGRFFIILIG